MSLTRYQAPVLSTWPMFDRLATLRDEMDQLFDLSFPARDTGIFSGWSPSLALFDDKNNFVATVELPGMKKEEIGISLQNGVLTVSGERKHEAEKSEGETFRSERYFGKFQRSITLPTAVDSKGVKAAYKDGILTVTLPKAEEAKPRQIAVSVD